MLRIQQHLLPRVVGILLSIPPRAKPVGPRQATRGEFLNHLKITHPWHVWHIGCQQAWCDNCGMRLTSRFKLERIKILAQRPCPKSSMDITALASYSLAVFSTKKIPEPAILVCFICSRQAAHTRQFEKLARASSGRHAPPVSTSGGKEADWLVHIFGYEPLDPDVDRADQLLCLSPGQLPRLPMSLVPVEKKNGGRPPWTARGSAANGGRPPSTATGSSVIFSAFLGASCLLESWFCSAPNLPQEARETDVDIRPCNEDMAMEVLELDEEEFEQSRTKGIEVAVRFEEDLQATPERHHGEAPADSKTASSRYAPACNLKWFRFPKKP